jgi:Protein of unknown function (DUF2924)
MMARADKLRKELDALATMRPADLKEYWCKLSGVDLPLASPSLLQHLIAYRLQEKALGKLPTHIERALERPSRICDPINKATKRSAPILPGTRFVRAWNGKTIAVTKTETGFEWDGASYRSLSEIARAVTGAHWSGPRFFGLTGQGR